MELICKKCNHKFEVEDTKLEGYYNWKCEKCYSIFTITLSPMIKWNCSRPDTPYRKI